MEDGFKYTRRKSGTPGARAGPSSNRVSGGAIVLKSEKSDKRDVSQRLSSSLPPDYPGLGVLERVPEDLPEEERMQMLIEEICELECKVERERLIKDFGPNDGAAMASALERAVSEFQLKVEELVVRGDVQFDVSTTALREMRDAKEEAKRRLEMQAEGLNAMVEGTEALCVRAERAAAVFSAALAEHDYRGLPHVHSPANLVKNLISFAKK